MTQADSLLARQHNVSPSVIVSLRQNRLAPEAHYTQKGNRVTYTEAGLAEVSRILRDLAADSDDHSSTALQLPGLGFTLWLPQKKEGADTPGPPDPTHPADSPPPAEQATTGRITRLMPNKTWVRIAFGSGPTEPCRVRAQTNLRIGMIIAVAQASDGTWKATAPSLSPRC